MNTFSNFPKEGAWEIRVKVLGKEKKESRTGTVYYLMQCQDIEKKVATVLLWENDYLSYRSELKNNAWSIIEIVEYNETYKNFKFGGFIEKSEDPNPKPAKQTGQKIDRQLRKIMGLDKKNKDELRRIMGL